MIEVARIIAKGDPPDWLVAGLEEFRFLEIMSDESPATIHQELIEDMRRAENAAATLLRLLPRLKGVIRCDAKVDLALTALPRIRQQLEQHTPQPHPYRWPEGKRQLCAAVVVEAWAAFHGKAELRSDYLYQACDAFWIACGGEPMPDISNWRHTVKTLPPTVRATMRSRWAGKEHRSNFVTS